MTSTGSSNNHYIPFLTGLAIAAALGARQILAGEFPARIKPLLAFVCLTATVAASLALWLYKDHNIPFFLPLAFIAVWLAYLRAARYEWTPRGHYELLAGVLAVGQFIVSFYYLPDYLPDAGYRANITELRAELLKLDAPVIWADYGNAPQALTGCKLTAAPSWVSLEDMTRQQVAPEIVAADIAPVMARWRHYDKLYILTNQPLEGLPGWKLAAWEFELERDYKKEFAAVREIALHWYSGGGYPRYLYRLRRPHSSSNASYYVQTRPTP